MHGDPRDIITPVNLSSRDGGGNPPQMRHRLVSRSVAWAVALGVLLAGGGLLWWSVSKAPPEIAKAPAEHETPPPDKIMPQPAATEHQTTSRPPLAPTAQPVATPPIAEPPAKRQPDTRPPAAKPPSQRRQAKPRGDSFQRHLSAGLSAYHERDYARARDRLRQAQALQPDADEVQAALAQVDQAMRLAQLANLRQQALSAEQSEQWGQALKLYDRALGIDGALQFAVQGQVRAQQRLRLIEQMQRYVRKPQLLESDNHLGHATGLLDIVNHIDVKGPTFTALSKTFARLVQMATTPVAVILASDNVTEVAVYRVGQLGTFETRELHLRPGTYAVVGSRDGYKDVRQNIVVKAGAKPLRVIVKCRDKI